MPLLASLALAALTTSAQVLTAGDGDERVAQPPVVHVASFGEGFELLYQQIGEAMGVPIEDEHPNADADSVQRTSTGLAVWRKGEAPSFTDGWRTYRLEIQGTQAQASVAAAPDNKGPPSSVWTRLAACEASGNWRINSGNGYYGGLQEDMAFWRNYGGLAYAARPDLATPEQQIAVAIRGQAAQGWGAWPRCSRIIGLR